MVEESGIAAPACGRVLATYYSHGMAALPPRSSRRRPRRGSLERPVSGRLYRGTWLLVGIPLLAAAFSVHKPAPLPPPPALPASFDGPSAVTLASDLARLYPDRAPGSAGAAGAAPWVPDQPAPYGLRIAPPPVSPPGPGPRGRPPVHPGGARPRRPPAADA